MEELNEDSIGGSAISPRIVEAIGNAKLIPVLRLDSATECVSLAERLLGSGLPIVEIAATTPEWLKALKEVQSSFPTRIIGVGTVLNLRDARDAIESGAEFLVCPHRDANLRATVGRYLIEGGLTPGDIHAAAAFGLAKLFPAHLGGTRYLRSLLAVYPQTRIMPTGGLSLNEARMWLEAGAFAVGIGSGLADASDPAGAILAAISESR